MATAIAAAVPTSFVPQPVTSAWAVAQGLVAAASAAPAADAPQMVATPARRAAIGGVVESALSSLVESTPGAPVQSPVSWVMLAAARRELADQPGVEALPAEAVSTSRMVDKTAQLVQQAAAGAAQAVATADATAAALSFGDIVQYTLFHRSATANPVQAPGQSATGVVTGNLNASSANGAALVYTLSQAPARGSVVLGQDGSYTYTPNASLAAAGGSDTFRVTIDNGSAYRSEIGGGQSLFSSLAQLFGIRQPDTISVTVPVTIVSTSQPVTNRAPVAGTPTVGTPNATTGVVIGQINATDPDGDTLTYSGSTTTAKGSVTVGSNGSFTFTPTATARHAAARIGAAAAAKTDTFTVTITDGEGGVATSTVSVAISPANSAPVAGTPTVGTPNATTGVVIGQINATDPDGDTLTYSTAATTTKGAVSLNSGTGAFTYTPTDAARTVAGTDTFTVTVSDGYGGSATVPVSVPITAKTQQGSLTFRFNYGSGSQYWTPEAKESLQSAADELASYIVVSTPVVIVFDVTAENSPNSGTLASAGSDLTSSRAGFYDTLVQNKILTGVDSNGSAADGEIDVNFGIPWAYGDSVNGSEYDFTSTAMHEILHTMGFLSYLEEPGSSWNATATNWATFDSFIVTDAEVNVIGDNYRWDTAYNRNLTGRNGGLYFGGPNAIAAYGGPVPLFTPRPWESGSSLSHLDDDTFTGAQYQMMNAYAPEGLGVRVLSAVELGILEDLGYTVVPIPGTASAMLFIGFIFLRRRKR